jgi:hypothetical protein
MLGESMRRQWNCCSTKSPEDPLPWLRVTRLTDTKPSRE